MRQLLPTPMVGPAAPLRWADHFVYQTALRVRMLLTAVPRATVIRSLRRRAERGIGACVAVLGAAGALCTPLSAARAQPGVQSVLTAAVLVLPLRPLDFSAVLPGVAKSVDAVDPRGGVLELRGDPTRQIRITLTLPTVILTSGGIFMSVLYGTSDAILATAFDPTLGTRFDPNAARLACFNASTGSLFLFLGGRVVPRSTQRRGDYAGTVVATVTYTGAPCP